MVSDNADVLRRLESVERQLGMMRARLDEPLQAAQSRRVQKFWESKACKNVRILGNAQLNQPVMFLGEGSITIGDGVQFGFHLSASFYDGYICVEARSPHSHIVIGAHTHINNNSLIVSEGEGIAIGERLVVGAFTEIYDSDFHPLRPEERARGVAAKTAKTTLGNDIFIGGGCKILKGVTIGDGSVIGGGSVVTGAIPANVVAAGNPARVIRRLA